MQYKVSVVISSFNYAHFIGETIESIVKQTYPAYEIIVVDDGSTDDSVEIIKSYGERVRLILQKNQGVCVARNNGARKSTGDIIAFLDSDDAWRPQKLERQVAAFESDAEVGLVSCGIRGFDPNGKTLYEYREGKSGWCANEIILFEPVMNFTASALAVRREVFEQSGGFDEQRELYAAEDREFCYRVAKQSKMLFVPEVLVDYRVHGGNGHLNIRRMEHATELVLEKIFGRADDETLKLKRRAYGGLYSTMAGSHFQVGDYAAFLKSAFKTLWLTPSKFWYFANFPSRLLKRKVSGFIK